MGFDRIGPYGFSRTDLAAAALALSFVIGSRSTRIMMWTIASAACLGIVFAIVIGEYAISAAMLSILLLIFVVGPALRSRKGNLKIYLSFDQEGLVAETDDVRTTYKWATLRAHRKIGSRLFIPIADGRTLIIADRFTTPANMTRLIATLESHAFV